MTRPTLPLILLALLPGPALADPPRLAPLDLGPPLSAAEFDAYSRDKTLIYGQAGVIWGSEHYLAGRQVVWAFTNQPCQHGTWYEDQGAICFVYDANPAPNCWQFFPGPTGLIARYLGGASQLSEVGQTSEPLNCPGPLVGS